MTRKKGSTAVHKTGHVEEIKDILIGKEPREGYDKYKELINERFDADLSRRQVRYFYNEYVLPLEQVTPKEAEEAIEEQRETINVAVEQMDLVELQRERIEKLNDIDPKEMMKEYNKHMGPDDKKKSIWYFIKGKAKLMRKEIELMGFRIQELKGIKQDLGLMKKEPEKLDIKTKEEKEIEIDALDDDLMKEIASKAAGVEDVGAEG